MKDRNILKRIRIILSLFMSLLFIVLFLDIGSFSSLGVKVLAWFQAGTSFLKFLTLGIGFGSCGFILVFFLTFLFGRVYCSGFCPFGLLQDLFVFLFKRKLKYIKPYNGFRYLFLVIIIVSVLSGSMILFGLFEPFSASGRISVNLVKPVLLSVHNSFISFLEYRGIYDFDKISLHLLDPGVLFLTFLFFIGIGILCFFFSRLYCNLLCPVGISLGLISRYSLFRIKIEKERCTGCGACEKICKAGCIDNRNRKIDPDRCVACFNCLDRCPVAALTYGRASSGLKTAGNGLDASRRGFLIFLFSSLLLLFKSFPLWAGQALPFLKIRKKYPVTPPGSQGISRFTRHCTGCHLCVNACPTRVITPSLFSYGTSGLFQPHLDYSRGFCEYECNLCSRVCPTGAIQPIPLEKKKQTQIGNVNLVKQNCIVYTSRTECGACSEHCPTKAVFLVPYKGLFGPEINPQICIGCGACENVCPTLPYKAIYVEGNPVHRRSLKPAEKKKRTKINTGFPF
ncbi:MAG: 4Fe-4S binding protein [bacterium]|nr:4Fe-4S binding protein [bacterium]